VVILTAFLVLGAQGSVLVLLQGLAQALQLQGLKVVEVVVVGEVQD